jgi:hypothetical protein
MGTRVIDSTPAAIATSTMPAASRPCTMVDAC